MGIVAIIVAISLDLIAYETFLFLIGGVFVPVFGILLADYFVLRGRRYEVDELYESSGAYWYTGGLNPVAIVVWVAGFFLYAFAGAAAVAAGARGLRLVGADMGDAEVGGTIPASVFSFLAYSGVSLNDSRSEDSRSCRRGRRLRRNMASQVDRMNTRP